MSNKALTARFPAIAAPRLKKDYNPSFPALPNQPLFECFRPWLGRETERGNVMPPGRVISLREQIEELEYLLQRRLSNPSKTERRSEFDYHNERLRACIRTLNWLFVNEHKIKHLMALTLDEQPAETAS